ncbi:hypothetical protein FRC12_004303 [Ceratobasidium sp. 428]|nr:hypothetical protein FRC09_015632 [Ceratobasidium sp. 395]KAG8687564.1 hypothetical protein FRC09_013422 [Ceratobasidium sp. 395]KAG8770383.1 hypothetical protein FRC12_004303 [Ceratobasidium sp. 428]
MSNQPALPSEIVHVDNKGPQDVVADQQAATQPGSGSAIPADEEHSANLHADQHAHGEKLPFKEQVKAYAKVHRGTVLPGHKDEKEVGQKILAGEIPPQ